MPERQWVTDASHWWQCHTSIRGHTSSSKGTLRAEPFPFWDGLCRFPNAAHVVCSRAAITAQQASPQPAQHAKIGIAVPLKHHLWLTRPFFFIVLILVVLVIALHGMRVDCCILFCVVRANGSKYCHRRSQRSTAGCHPVYRIYIDPCYYVPQLSISLAE